jgi:predicted RNA-binding protein with PIN domain
VSEGTVLETRQKIVVDGYNVIFTDDTLRNVAIRDRERARRDLLSRIGSYLAGRELWVTVVFDGKGCMVDEETIVPGKLQAVYSASHQTADELIIAMVAGSEAPTSYIVVTSDKAHIRPAVSEMGCRVIGSKTFLERLRGKAPSKPRGEDEDKRHVLGEVDVDYWLDVFEGGSEGDR